MASSTQARVPSQLPVQHAIQTPVSSALSVEPTAQAPVSSSLPVQPFPTPMYKNQLQEFAQRSAMAVPMYQTHNEGHQHAPKFRSTVLVDGLSFTSELTFPQRKAAEQEAARLALECLTKKIKEEVYSFIRENATLCKSILNEYAAKLTIDKPTFNTVRQEGVVPLFASSLVFNGTSYTGDAAKSKKEAEQLVARAVVLSILGNPDSGMMIFQMIKSKSKFYDTANTKGLQSIYASGVSPIANTADSSIVMDHKDKEIVDAVVKDHNDKKVADPVGEDHKDNKIADPVGMDHTDKKVADPVAEDHKDIKVADPVGEDHKAKAVAVPVGEDHKAKAVAVPVGEDHIAKAVAVPVCEDHKAKAVAVPVGEDHIAKAVAVPVCDTNNAMLSTCQQSQMPRQEPTPEATKSPNGPQQPVNTLPTEDSSSSKKRRKNKYKANKKARRESELQAAGILVNQQAPPCSVAQ